MIIQQKDFYSLFTFNVDNDDVQVLKYILGILNSTLITYYMKEKNWIKIIPGKNPQIRVDSVKKIPICINQKSYNNQIIGLVDQILKAKQLNPMVDTSSLDLEIIAVR